MSDEKIESKEKTLDEIRTEADAKACAVQRLASFLDQFLSGPMCGRCFPCAFGSYEAKLRTDRMTTGTGDGDETDITILRRIGALMQAGSRCKKGKDTGQYISGILSNAVEEFREHLSRICPAGECVALIEYRIDPDRCTLCGKCLKVCRDDAILGEPRNPLRSGYLPFEIRQKRCTRCGECMKVCPEHAIGIHSVGVPARKDVSPVSQRT